MTLGHFGHADGELDHPSDVAVDPSGTIYVADTDNQRIAVFAPDGKFLRNFGGAGPYPGLFHTPTGIEYFDDRLYVADSGNHRIQVFDLKGEVQYEWGVHSLVPREGRGKLHYPNQIAIAPSGKFAVVVESFENRVQIFGPATEESRILQDSQEKSMGAHFGAVVAAAGPTMAILEPSTPSLILWDVAGEEPIELTRFGRFGPKPGTFIRPEGVALDPEGRRAYIADPGQMTISVLDVARPKVADVGYLPELGRFVKAVDLRAIDDPTHATWPIEPTAIRIGPRKDLWVIDAANRRVVVFDEKLSFQRAIGVPDRPATGDPLEAAAGDRFLEPTDLALSPDGELLYVVDAGHRWVRVFEAAGKPVGTIGPREAGPSDFTRPFGVAVAPDGDVYVSDEGADRVVRYDKTGAQKGSFGKRGLGRVEFFKPKGLTFDAKGNLIVLDWGNHRGQVLTREGEFIRAFGSRIFVVPTLKKP